MAPGILRGSRDHCLAALRADEFDLIDYPLRTYSDLDRFRLMDQDIPIFQGVNTVDDSAAEHAGFDVPGVVPFLVSTLQVSARRRHGKPYPTEVGLPLLTTESGCLIRWMFGRDGNRHGEHTLWRRLASNELEALPAEVRPNGQILPDARTAASYGSVSGAIAAPEPADFVRPRAGGLPHEPWLARSVELAESWRVVVPNTSISCRPVVVPPALTIVGQNFNTVLCPSPEVAIAIGTALSRPEPQEYLIGISPWSRGDTPRPRSKHVNTTLCNFAEHIRDMLTSQRADLASFADQLQKVWEVHLAATISLARGDDAAGNPLRDRYRAIEPRDALDALPTALDHLEDRWLTLTVEEGAIRLRFRTPEEAALAAVAAWTGLPRRLSVGSILAMRFRNEVTSDADAVQEVLFNRRWSELVGSADPEQPPDSTQ